MFPLVTRSTSAALEKLDDSLMEAAETFGAGIMTRFRRVALPIVLPGIVSGCLLVAISALGEFVSSILLYTYASRPISVEILSQLRGYNFGAAAAYSVFLLVVIVLLLVVSSRRDNRDPVGQGFTS
jgi:iron(III) transport system permease protein